MKKTDKEKVVRALTEATSKVWVGKLRITLRPITFAQIYEMGACAHEIKPINIKDGDKVNTMHELFEHYKDAKAMGEIFLVCAYRKGWKRRLFRKYILSRLTINEFNKLIKFISTSFNANFFLTSINFLSQAKIMTEPTTTLHGPSSEE